MGLSFTEGVVLFLVGTALTIVFLVLDKAGKLKGPMLLILLAAAALMVIAPLLSLEWVTNTAGQARFARTVLIVSAVGVAYSLLAVWVSSGSEEKISTTVAIAESSPPSAQEIADEVARLLQPGLRQFLIPANDVTPKNNCDEYPIKDRDALKLALIGPAHVLYAPRERPISMIRIGETTVLGVERAQTGIVINAILNDANGKLLAEIKKNVWVPHAMNDYEVRSNDNQILILNSRNEVVLFVRYLNPQAIKVLGTFNVQNHRTVTIDEGQILVGDQKLAIQLCAVDNAPEGAWYQMESLLQVP